MAPEARPDPHNLNRFIKAQEPVYATVLAELDRGRKRTHWMWFIFPQIEGLGHSSTAKFFAIKTLAEARAYVQHPILGKRLLECAGRVLTTGDRTAAEIFGYPDELKLRSSMTLFACLNGADAVFEAVLDRFFGGGRDVRTLELLKSHSPGDFTSR